MTRSRCRSRSPDRQRARTDASERSEPQRWSRWPTRGLPSSIRKLIDEARRERRSAEQATQYTLDDVQDLFEMARDPEVPVDEVVRALERAITSPDLQEHPQLLLTHLEVVYEHRLWSFAAIARRAKILLERSIGRPDQSRYRGSLASIRRAAEEQIRHATASVTPSV